MSYLSLVFLSLVSCADSFRDDKSTGFSTKEVERKPIDQNASGKSNVSSSAASPAGGVTSSLPSSADVTSELENFEKDTPSSSTNPQLPPADKLSDNSSSPTFEQTPPPSSLDEQDKDLAAKDEDEAAKVCAKVSGKLNHEVKRFDFLRNTLSLDQDDALLFRISGNQKTYRVSLKTGKRPVRSICVFLSGHRNSLSIELVDKTVERLILVGRGDQNNINVAVHNCELKKSFVNLAGNKNKIDIGGTGLIRYPEETRIRGNNNSFSCPRS